MAEAEIGIIGGTGIYDPNLLENVEEVNIDTKWGKPSHSITVGEYEGRKVAFIPRHGPKHTIQPHNINFRANIAALKGLGVTRILAPQAVGSLREETKPGHLVIPDQFIDRTWGRPKTFYDEEQVCHISMAEPFCGEQSKLLVESAKGLGFDVHSGGTYVCIQGPRFSTKAESKLFRQWNCDIIGMTLVPECVLAREAEICYSSISMVTDYDCWKDSNVTLEEVIQTMKANQDKVKKLLIDIIPKIPKERACPCKSALEGALI